MATTIKSAAPNGDAAPVKHPKRRLRKLEKRLSTVRAVEAKRTRQAEQARAAEGATTLVAKRARQLEKASNRGKAIEADIAALRALAPLVTAGAKSIGTSKPGVATAHVAKAQAAKPTVLRAFCLRERRTVDMQDPKPMVMKNGRSATVGTCPSCGARLIRPG